MPPPFSEDHVGELSVPPNQDLCGRRYYIYVDDGYTPRHKDSTPPPPPPPPVKKANPGPLGLLGFGMTTVLLNVHNTGFYPLTTAVVGMGLCYGGLVQLIAGLFEFVRGNTFGYVAFCSYGAFWMSLVCTWMFQNNAFVEGHPVNPTDAYFLGVYLLMWGIFTFFMFINTLRTNLALMTVFGSLMVLFVLLAAGNMGHSPVTLRVAGFEGIFCGASALYLAFAEVTNEVYGRELLPVGSIDLFLDRGKKKAEGNKLAQV
ncbi:putative GTP-binding protein typA/BipA-like [Trypanosoma grayi]|uniref:putative GTP-binding protein typA/BipA-like n=1 Tax=Trypanosoma grayi TaxID=71804 RepID=UPI0004F418D0|nr:putative GTP-binding protein typA/BipA-like [Trypanosoma grayi]KEG15565.1 putative GTP-binding protein typA/BipA-like [Trypanosoma grayi]